MSAGWVKGYFYVVLGEGLPQRCWLLGEGLLQRSVACLMDEGHGYSSMLLPA